MSNEDKLVQGIIALPGSRPSWQTSGDGYAEVHYIGHTEARWFTVSILESGEKSSKTTMATLNQRQVHELAQACLKTLGVSDEIRAKVTIACLDVEKPEKS